MFTSRATITYRAVRNTGVEESTKLIHLMEHKRTTSNYLKTTMPYINVPEPKNFVADKLSSEAKNNIGLEERVVLNVLCSADH